LEQVDQAAQVDTTQSTGQASVLQALVCSNTGHCTPPWAAAVTMDRVDCWRPVPHDKEQAAQLPQELTSQSTGQDTLLQA
jgi:hypothetical protein